MTEEEYTGFKRKHYRVNTGSAWEAANTYRTRRDTVSEQHLDYGKGVGGVGVYPGHHERLGNATAIHAVIFEGELPSGWKRRSWSSFRDLPRGNTAAWPDKRTTAGKAALAAIAALPLLPDPDQIAKAISFPTSLRYKDEAGDGVEALGLFDTVGIGWIKDTFYLSLPDYAGKRAKREADGCTVTTPPWTAPEGMEEVLKEEVDLDYAREKLASAA